MRQASPAPAFTAPIHRPWTSPSLSPSAPEGARDLVAAWHGQTHSRWRTPGTPLSFGSASRQRACVPIRQRGDVKPGSFLHHPSSVIACRP